MSTSADQPRHDVHGRHVDGDVVPAEPYSRIADGAGAEGLEWEVPSPAPFHTFETPPKLDATATKVVG